MEHELCRHGSASDGGGNARRADDMSRGAGGRAHGGPSFNISPAQFANRSIVVAVARALAASSLPARRLTLERTQSLLPRDPEDTKAWIGQLGAPGSRVALDDVGAAIQRSAISPRSTSRQFKSAGLSSPPSPATLPRLRSSRRSSIRAGRSTPRWWPMIPRMESRRPCLPNSAASGATATSSAGP